jgi:hypothetical protein
MPVGNDLNASEKWLKANVTCSRVELREPKSDGGWLKPGDWRLRS